MGETAKKIGYNVIFKKTKRNDKAFLNQHQKQIQKIIKVLKYLITFYHLNTLGIVQTVILEAKRILKEE